jgi:DNA-binding CsgD family transcriptional regulator
MTNELLSLTKQGLATIFSHLSADDYKVVWMRNPDYSKQLYVSPAYETVWGRTCSELYEHPISWEDTLVGDEKHTFAHLIKSRKPTADVEQHHNNTVLYRIFEPNGNIRWIKDSHFYLFDNHQHQVGIAGIAEAISETQWLLEMEKNCNFFQDKSFKFEDQFINILENEFNLTARSTPHAILLDSEFKQYCHIITHDNERVPLSQREIECIHHLSKGLTAKEIAREINISPRTVEEYMSRIKDKTHSKNLLEMLGKIKGFAI